MKQLWMISVVLLLSITTVSWAQVTGIGGAGSPTSFGTYATNTIVCAYPDPDSCIKSDLVVISQGKILLLRGVYGCGTIRDKLKVSGDLPQVECFR